MKAFEIIFSISRGSLLATASAAACLFMTAGCTTDGDGDGDGDDGFAFAEDEPDAYERVDRVGMPGVGTAVIASKEDYNLAGPSQDVDGDFVGEITASVEGLHAALDDDLTGLGLVPCAPADCVGQAAPFVVPDTISIDLEAVSAFPNGRRLTDPVMDITLALLLLDLSDPNQDAASLVGALNPTENDKSFGSEFPYLATPHEN